MLVKLMEQGGADIEMLARLLYILANEDESPYTKKDILQVV